MQIAHYVFSLVVCLMSLAHDTRGHGRLMEPPARASLWRFGFSTPINYNDNELFCGGFATQWFTNQGRCGICGDNWQGPRDNEAGGQYARGVISRQYKQGQVIPVQVDITAYHQGWFEFRLCPNNDVTKPATHECLDRNVLEMADGSGSRWYFPPRAGTGSYHFQLRLPYDVTCTQCVFQWKYHGGNSWGTDPDGRSCVGCGPQEEFYGCADVSISGTADIPPRSPTTTPTTTIRPRTLPPVTTPQTMSAPCKAIGTWANVPSLDSWCIRNCADGYCPVIYCRCE